MRFRHSAYCKYCGNRAVMWKKHWENGKSTYTLIDLTTGKPHTETCPEAK